MTREQYLIDREAQRIDMQSAYEVYLSKNTNIPKVGIDQFTHLFSVWVRNSKPFIDRYFEYWDEKFDIKKGE